MSRRKTKNGRSISAGLASALAIGLALPLAAFGGEGTDPADPGVEVEEPVLSITGVIEIDLEGEGEIERFAILADEGRYLLVGAVEGIEAYVGKRVTVTGELGEFHGVPAIDVESFVVLALGHPPSPEQREPTDP